LAGLLMVWLNGADVLSQRVICSTTLTRIVKKKIRQIQNAVRKILFLSEILG
jgi:hypothetical protein